MRRSRFSDEQIIAAIKEVEAGVATADLCRRLGITPFTFYRWRKKFGGMEVDDARRLKQLEDENGKLKRLLAEEKLDNHALKVALGKN